MMKKILEEIHKMAQTTLNPVNISAPDSNAPPSPPPGVVGPSRTKKQTGTPLSGTTTISPSNRKQIPIKNKAVVKMQEKMKELADMVMRDVKYSDLHLVNPDDVHHKDDGSGRGDFMDFFAQNFVGELPKDYRGVEWSADKSKTSYEEKQKGETSVYEMNVVMDTIQRMGSSSKEFKPDGNWEWRTQNALKNILGFIYAMIQLSGEMGYAQNIFSLTKWSKFQRELKGIPVEDKNVKLTPKEETRYAYIFIGYINDAIQLYTLIRNKFLGDANVRPYLEGAKAFKTIQVADPVDSRAKLVGDDRRQYEHATDTKIPIQVGTDMYFVPLSALTSVTSYVSWAKNVYGYSGQRAQQLFNGFIKPEIDKMYDANKEAMKPIISQMEGKTTAHNSQNVVTVDQGGI